MQKKLIIKQHGIKDCGACSLLSIIRYYHGNISLNKLLELTSTSKLGTTFYDLKTSANYLGLSAIGYKIENDLPKNIKVPFICQIIKNNYTHFIVVYKIKNNNLLVMDPSIGKTILKLTDFYKIWTKYIMIFEKNKELPNIKDKNYIKYLILNTIKQNKTLIINTFILSIIFNILSIINSYQLKFLINDDYLNIYSYNIIKYVTLSFIIIIVIRSLSNLFRNQLLINLNQKIDINLFTTTIKNILYLPYNYYKNKTTGEIISRISDITYVRNVISKILLTVLLDFLLIITSAIFLLKISKTLFIIALLIVLFYIIIIIIFNPKIKSKINKNLENNAILNTNLIEDINSFETIKGLNIENNIFDDLDYIYSKSSNNILKLNTILNKTSFLKELIGLIGLLLINIIGISKIMEGNMSLSNLIVFNSILVYFHDPINNIIDSYDEYYLAIASLKRANALYEIESENFKKTTDLEINGNIEIKNLSFSYNHYNVLNNINIKINDKEKILILGKSGSGKSTLLKILYKYYNIKREQIKINNYDINDFKLNDIRSNILYISQNEILYTKSIKENIILNRNILESDFLKLTSLCYVDKIVKDNILGYDMLLEENGVNISGGERQRIILARSLLKQSKIILIDEGFSQIDIKLERKILKNIFNYYKDKTFIIISHRHDNMDLYDKIINLDKGIIYD